MNGSSIVSLAGAAGRWQNFYSLVGIFSAWELLIWIAVEVGGG